MWLAASLLLMAGLAPPEAALAQRSGQQLKAFEGVGIEEQLGETLPMDLVLTNADGQAVRLGDYFDGETPVVMQFAYFSCPMLCPLMLDGLTTTLQGMAWTPGDEFEVVTVSFDPRDTPEQAAREKAKYVQKLGKYGAAEGWHFLTADEATINTLTQAAGFNFKWIEAEQEFAHPTAVLFLSGEGKLSRYLFGMQPSPGDARKALVEASNGEVGSIVDQAILYCFQFDPNENSYVANAFNIMRLGGVLTMLILGGMLFFFWRREGGSGGAGGHEAEEAPAPLAGSAA